MHRRIIIVDIDDILHDLNRSIRERAAAHGHEYTEHEVIDWGYLVRRFGLKKFLEILGEVYTSDQMHVYDDGHSALQQLADAGFELHYFTDRPEGFEQRTAEWMSQHAFPQSEHLHVCADKRTDIIAFADAHTGDICAVVDDRPRTMVWALHQLKAPHVFSLRKPYNQNLSDVEGVHLADSWSELAELMMSKLKTG